MSRLRQVIRQALVYLKTLSCGIITGLDRALDISITHILEIDRDHFNHLDIQAQTNKYLAMQQLQFNPVLLESST